MFFWKLFSTNIPAPALKTHRQVPENDLQQFKILVYAAAVLPIVFPRYIGKTAASVLDPWDY